MQARVSDVLRIVSEEIEVYRDLVEHARRKTALLVHGRLESIIESNKVEETFGIKLRILETEMERLCAELSEVFKISQEDFTLLKLADAVEPSVAEEIRRQIRVFKNLIEQLRSINRRNLKLAENSMHYSRGLLDFLANATSSYQRTGLFRPIHPARSSISHQA